MKKTSRKWIVGSIVTVFALLAILGVALASISDWNGARPWINKTVSAAIDRPFAIKGDLRLHWVRNVATLHYRIPRPQITAEQLVIGNPAWTAEEKVGAKDFGTVRKVTAVLDPLPLFDRSVVLPLLDIDTAQVSLVRRPDGRNNWTFGKAEKEPKDPKKQWRFAPGLMRVYNSWVELDDAARKLQARATANSYEKGIRWAVQGTLNDAPLRGNGMAGSLLALQDKKTPYPFALNLDAGDNHIEARGTLTNPSQLAALDVNLKLSGTSMAQLYALTNITLPETPPFSTDGHLTGVLNEYGGRWHYENFNGTIGGSDIHGDVLYEARSTRPLLTAKVVSNNLNFVDLAPLIGADSNASKERRNAEVRQPEDKVLPIEPFKTDRWGSIDARVDFTGKKIIPGKALPIENLHAKLDLTDGILKLAPLQFGLAGGTLKADIKLDSHERPLLADIEMTTQHLQLKQLFPTVEAMQASAGEINGSADLVANGNSIADLAGSSSGEVRLFVDRATVSKFLLEAAGLNIANLVVTKLFGDRQVRLNCAAADFNVEKGLMKSEDVIIDTEEALIDVDGEINLTEEKLDLKVKPQTKGLRILSLRTPLYLSGTFKKPDVGLDKGVLALRGGGAVALGTVALPAALVPLIATGKSQLPEDHGCVALLEHSREATEAQTAAMPQS